MKEVQAQRKRHVVKYTLDHDCSQSRFMDIMDQINKVASPWDNGGNYNISHDSGEATVVFFQNDSMYDFIKSCMEFVSFLESIPEIHALSVSEITVEQIYYYER